MKVQHLSLGFSWPAPEKVIPSSPSSSSSLSSSSSSSTANHPKRLRPLAPKLSVLATSPEFMTAKFASTRSLDSSSLMQSGGGSGTRWNPMPEQIKLLEALYQGGMRTPNPAQIERITAELGRYGRIEGKNVFYWFQNHKARERQKQKRSAALLALAANNSPLSSISNIKMMVQLAQKDERKTTSSATTVKKKKEVEAEEGAGCCKRKCRSWGSAADESGATDRTLELFPLRPEWKQMG